MRHREAMAEARKRGKARGEAAGSWVTDGNTTEATFAALRRMMNGDETARDESVRPRAPEWLSGEWAGESVSELLGDILPDESHDPDYYKAQDIKDAYCEAADQSFENEWQSSIPASTRGDTKNA